MSNKRRYPIQNDLTTISEPVHMAAYEVYCEVWRPQPALIEGNCRGGFGTSELLALLYARGYPRSEWRQRFREATVEGGV